MRWLDGINDFNGHEFEQVPGDGEGQGSLVCCSPWGHKESDMTGQLNNNNNSGGLELTGFISTILRDSNRGLTLSLVAQLCLTLCDPMDCSTSGFPVHHQLPEHAQTHVH